MKSVNIPIEEGDPVSGLLQLPPKARACYVMAHGAGAGMTHAFLQSMSDELEGRGIATLRYQFSYMERGSRRPDPPHVAHRAVRAAVARAASLAPGLPLLAGGKSFGGRMTSQAQAIDPLTGVSGLIFLGFPLHPAGKPSTQRAEHLSQVKTPMLFLQGSRDDLADLSLLEPLVRSLGKRATLVVHADADHSFHVPARSGRSDAEVRSAIADTIAEWAGTHTR